MPLHEEKAHYHQQEGSHHRTGNREQDSRRLGQERQHEQDGPDCIPDAARRDAGESDERDDGRRVDYCGQRACNSGQERAQSVGVDSALHQAKVGCLRADPGDPLNHNAIAAHLDANYETHDQERR